MCRFSWCTTTTWRARCAPGCSAGGAPGTYNLAGPGQLTVSELARELGWYSIPVPELAIDAVAEMVARLGILPAQAQWVSAFREPVIMDVAKARSRAGVPGMMLWTLRETITAARMVAR